MDVAAFIAPQTEWLARECKMLFVVCAQTDVEIFKRSFVFPNEEEKMDFLLCLNNSLFAVF